MFSEEEPRTPTHIWLDAKIRDLSAQAIGVYVLQKGEKMSGLVLLKVVANGQNCKLLMQERNFETGALDWVDVFEQDIIDEKKADDYINRAVGRDPDLWVVEVEDSQMNNPFQD